MSRPLSQLSRIELVAHTTVLQAKVDLALTALQRAEAQLRAECYHALGLESWKVVHAAIVSLGGTTS